MARYRTCVMLAIVVLFHCEALHAGYLQGQISLNILAGNILSSTARVTYFGTFGGIDSTVMVSTSHKIVDAGGYLVAQNYEYHTGSVVSTLSTVAAWSTCYRAWNDGQAEDKTQGWGTPLVCLPTPAPPDSVEECYSPIVIDLGKRGFKFTDAAHGVLFDGDADGVTERTAWTEVGSDDVFLVLDRNGNGWVDDGSELFGNHTPQPPSADPNGYEALAVFDDHALGGNGDGRITVDDALYGGLRLWNDANQNGISENAELLSLSDSGVISIDLDYRESRRRDRHGNTMRFLSKVQLDDGHQVWSTDVFFAVLAPGSKMAASCLPGEPD